MSLPVSAAVAFGCPYRWSVLPADSLPPSGVEGLDINTHTHHDAGDLFFRDYTIYDSASRMKAWNRKFKLLLTYPQVRR